MTYHFPDAYSGQNTKIRDTLNNLILKSPQNWQTTVGLPFFQIEGTVVEWDEVKFDVRLMQRVPYEGVSRMQTSLKRKHRDRVVRRGLALIIESDFVRFRPLRTPVPAPALTPPSARAQYATDAGRQHFADQLTSIRYCVQETCSARRDLQPFQPRPPCTGSRSPASPCARAKTSMCCTRTSRPPTTTSRTTGRKIFVRSATLRRR